MPRRLYLDGPGMLSCDTPTVGELIAKLREFPEEMLVAYTWEGQILPVRLDGISAQTAKLAEDSVLLLDAES